MATCPTCNGDSASVVGGTLMDMLERHTTQPGGSAGDGGGGNFGIGCQCAGSGLLGGGPEPGSVEASGSPADLTMPVG